MLRVPFENPRRIHEHCRRSEVQKNKTGDEYRREKSMHSHSRETTTIPAWNRCGCDKDEEGERERGERK